MPHLVKNIWYETIFKFNFLNSRIRSLNLLTKKESLTKLMFLKLLNFNFNVSIITSNFQIASTSLIAQLFLYTLNTIFLIKLILPHLVRSIWYKSIQFFQQSNKIQPDSYVSDNRRHKKERQIWPQRQERAGIFRTLHARWHHQAHGRMHHSMVCASQFLLKIKLVRRS